MLRDVLADAVAGDLVSVPFDAGRGLMRGSPPRRSQCQQEFQYPSMRVVD